MYIVRIKSFIEGDIPGRFLAGLRRRNYTVRGKMLVFMVVSD